MNIDELKTELSSVLNQKRSVQLYFLLKVQDELVLRLADIEDKNTAPDIQQMFEGMIKDSILSKEDLVIRELSKADDDANVLYRYDYDTYPEELGLLNSFNIKEAVNTKLFNFKVDDLSHLFGFIIYIGSMDHGFMLFKKHYNVSLIKRGNFCAVLKSDTRFERLNEDIIRLNNDAQVLRVNNTLLVLNLKFLEKNNGFLELVKKDAQAAVTNIENLDILDDIDVLKETLEDPSFARKLAKVHKTSPVFKLNVSKEAIIKFTKSSPELAGKFKYSDDGTRIKLGTKQSKVNFIKLMSDNFLRSELTKQWYESSSKDSIAQTTE